MPGRQKKLGAYQKRRRNNKPLGSPIGHEERRSYGHITYKQDRLEHNKKVSAKKDTDCWT